MIELEDVPELRDPVLIAAFEGWNDAGEAATAAVDHLIDLWDAEPIAALDPEDYYDFQVNRPRVVLDEGRRRISWRTTRILLATTPGIGRDVILVQGIEPSFRWRAFTIELMEFAQQAGVTTVFTLGALMADVAHTRPIPVTATSDSEDVLHRYDLEPSRYEGPTGIVGVLADAATQAGLQSISCWAAVPHYAGHSPSPKATLGLVSKLEELIDAPIPHGDLPEAAKAWERGINELAETDDEVAEYVQSLEEAQDTAELPEASGDAIAREFERYLRRRGHDGGGPG
ncbi:Proteasome assembly chaperone (PAC2) family protein [Pedococcus cremeus]|uniref:Proteasome assembly chaperone (PAC2) family protein n=1 Tax=Pedococcus cremeus TaxID=587636 RepID=A0A1H9WXG9_9MICO|nr:MULTISPECIES: PAC2 family protein [Intrasporangiaceae]TQJ50856.1 proteasome assembly chaperone (PAC2) family protein [Phycicoccus sp. SLBN-51]SES38519.1 Proteasome assembly chaperone (PAC2) family protein [Pedococcus cremeus]